MIEKIKNFDYLNSTEQEVEKLISELVKLPKDELKDVINNIVDTIDYKFTSDESDEKLPNSYELIFNNDIIKSLLDELLDDLSDKVE